MTKNNRLKVIALALVISVLTVFSGCNSWSESSSANDGTSSINESSSQQDEGTEQSNESSAPDSDNVQGEATPLIWEVKSPDGGNTLYLFGSIHVGDEDIFPLNDTVMDAYNSCDCLAVEIDLVKAEADLQLQMSTTQMLIYTDGTTVKDHISTETYDKTVAYLKEKNMYSPMFDYYHPFVFEQQLLLIEVEQSGLSADAGIDRHFLKLAKTDEKEIIEVESQVSQIEMLLSLPDKYYELSLSSMVDMMNDSTDESLIQLFNAWKYGDIAELNLSVSSEEGLFEDGEQELYDEYIRLMYTDRNTLMAQTADGIIKDGKTCFFVVGVAHMVGDSGIVSQLESMGYTVTRI